MNKLYETSKQVNAYDLYKEGMEAFEKMISFLQIKNFLKQN